MAIIKAPLAGEFTWHVVDLYCASCKKVTSHQMKFAKIDEEDGKILANCICQNRKSEKHVLQNQWNVTVHEWTCQQYQCLAITKDQWLLLISGLSTGGRHKRRC